MYDISDLVQDWYLQCITTVLHWATDMYHQPSES